MPDFHVLMNSFQKNFAVCSKHHIQSLNSGNGERALLQFDKACLIAKCANLLLQLTKGGLPKKKGNSCDIRQFYKLPPHSSLLRQPLIATLQPLDVVIYIRDENVT